LKQHVGVPGRREEPRPNEAAESADRGATITLPPADKGGRLEVRRVIRLRAG